MVASPSGPFGGLLPPIPPSGAGVYPYGLVSIGNTITITASRAYIIPFPIFRTQAYSGAQIVDSGAGNNGQLLRCGIYAEAATGGPGALIKDFGLVTLTGTGGLHQFAAAVTIPGPQMCYLILIGNSASVLKGFNSSHVITSVGANRFIPHLTTLGDMTAGFADQSSGQLIGWYAALAYPGAMPATGPTQTTSILDTTGASNLPGAQLYT